MMDEATDGTTEPHGEAYALIVQIDPRINYALQQNDVPVVKEIRVENRSQVPLKDVQVEISAEPEFASPWKQHLAVIPEAGCHVITTVDLLLSPDYLANLSERMRGILHVRLRQGESVLSSRAEPVELLAYDEWSGLQSLPEILAAFVLPNHPAVETILVRASSLLKGSTVDSSLSGYQSRSRERVWKIIEAIYLALAEQDLRYCAPPASFEETGQKIRTPDRVLDGKLATCLDTSALVAACLEQVGLNPLIVFLKGHAFVGVWMDDECFPLSAEDDLLKLRKRVELGEICVFETTLLTATPRPDFSRAVEEGRRHLLMPDNFHCMIDVRRARKSSIRPLPLRTEGGRTVIVNEPPTTAIPGFTASPGVVKRLDNNVTEDAKKSRLDVWRRKLLDLSLNNRLLNYKDNKKVLPIVCDDLAGLEDAIAGGVSLRVRARPIEFGASDPRDPEAFRRRTGDEGLKRLVAEELKEKRLCGDVTEQELERRLIEIFRSARTSIEEGGASALYLAVGFIRWYETKTSQKALLAPILLVPVELERRSIQHGFTIVRGADDTRANTTLIEMLRQDFGFAIPGMDQLPQDDSGVDVALILRRFREAIKDIDRWEVLDTAALGFFSFAKFLMWRDLEARSEDLLNSPIVRHLVEQDGSRFDPDFSTVLPDRLDEVHDLRAVYSPMDADSSQLWAVMSAAQGRTFVLEGPPGTGKSQTITNIIAHSLASGKTVLFVSEKSAALNVVFSRLKKLRLDPYCLELHSNKARKHDVVQQLGEVLNIAVNQPKENWETRSAELAKLRNELNALVDALHRRRSNGLTVFIATSKLSGLRDMQRVLLAWASPDDHSQEALDGLRDSVESLVASLERIGIPSQHPWRQLSRSVWSNSWQASVEQVVATTLHTTQELKTALEATTILLGIPGGGATRQHIHFVSELSEHLLMRPAMPAEIIEREEWKELLATMREWVKSGMERDQYRIRVFVSFKKNVIESDISGLLYDWERILASNPLPSLPENPGQLATEVNSWSELIRTRHDLRTDVFRVFREEILVADVNRISDLWTRSTTAPALIRPIIRWRAHRSVRTLLKNPAVSSEDALRAVSQSVRLKETEDAIQQIGEPARIVLGDQWNRGEPDQTRLTRTLDWLRATAALTEKVDALSVSDSSIPRGEILKKLRDAEKLIGLEATIKVLDEQATALLGRYWNHGEADWHKVQQALQWVYTVRKAVDGITKDAVAASELRRKVAALVTQSRDALRADADIGSKLTKFRTDWQKLLAEQKELCQTLDFNTSSFPVSESSPTFISDIESVLAAWSSSTVRIREWCDWNSRRARARASGLAPLLEALEQRRFSYQDLVPVFERSYIEWWLGKIVDNEEILRQFSSVEHGRLIEKFRKLDKEYLRLTSEFIGAKLAAQVPQATANIVGSSEMGILQHELRKKRRHTSIRTLVGKIPNLLPRLKPCVLMSPMSVAQYLDSGFRFDIVVFDEASQIPIWDAAGALARGKQAVIVGDPKQLPPTNFFMRSDEESEETEDTLQDLESVLDDCLGAQVPQLHLNWHYRSRHESLIHFSNHYYYEDRLLTFPSPTPKGMGVQWHHVANGVYGRSKDRSNKPEAEAVVAEVVRRLKDRRLQKFSIGVVTFSGSQQAVVEEFLDAARRENPEIEKYFSDDEVEEPVFVKNLENVQGDERDVIIFSICYGPDQSGLVSMNFGPLNRTGGERRLNVAVTRARRELLVYSSLRADMINLARTKATGAVHLKSFLDYAERGPAALSSTNVFNSDAEFESPLEEQIHDALVSKGWQVHKQVGCSGYRIDLAVVHPDSPGKYIVGVECDGANYHRAKSARDRDRLREAVLKDLGWNLLRVWSTDWWTDPLRETARIDAAIRDAIDSAAQSESTIETTNTIETNQDQQVVTEARIASGVVIQNPSGRPIRSNSPGISEDGFVHTVYRPYVIERPIGSQQDFEGPAADKEIASVLMKIVSTEGPVALSVASRRVAAHWGFQKATSKVLEKVKQAATMAGTRIVDSGGVSFLWSTSMEPSTFTGFRVNGTTGDSVRSADEIPIEEFGNGILFILANQFSLPEDDLRVAAARLFGFQRTGSAVASRIDLAIEYLATNSRAAREQGRVSIPRT